MDEREWLSVSDAYRAMFRFLEACFERTKAGEVAVLFGSMNLADDGRPMDPAMWQDWLMAVQEAISGDPDIGAST
ncbi:MAG: hypothetical protein AB7T19_05750 [Planctomycetota bacterium]